MTYDKYTCEVGHPALRREFIGSSDASAIMGVSPWDTPLTLWETKLGLRPSKDLSYAMSRGIDLEQAARDKMQQLTGLEFKPKRLFSEKFNYMMANLDGISKCGNYSVEIKCPGASDHACAIAGVVPTKYYPQLQHQMIVSGHKIMYYMSYTLNDPVVIKVESDLGYQEDLIKKEYEFYMNLQEFKEPKKIDRDHNKRNDPAWRDAAHKYRCLCTMKKSLDDQIEDARNTLLSLCEDRSTEGCGLKVIKSSRKGNIQYSKIPEIQYVDLENYRLSPIESWKIYIDGDQND